jgi:predicted ATP-binding protein involved in virulence
MAYLTRCFPNTQFIVTAHSPLIVQAAGEDANIALLRREGDHVLIDNNVETIRGWRIDQLLTSDLFGLPSARPPQLDALLERRKELLTKARLTAADKQELTELEEKIGPLPMGETAEEARAMALIEESIKLLNQHQDKDS